MVNMSGRSALGELFDSVQAANGWTLRELEERAKKRGEKLSKSHIGNLVDAYPLTSISQGAIHALAAALGVSPNRVALAAIRSMGFQIASDDVTPAEAIARDESLSEDTKEALLAILRGVERRRGA